jgi:hypothetical protein
MCKDLLIPNESTKEASSPKYKIAYPCEFFQSVNAGGHFRKPKEGEKPKYITDEECVMPEYFKECFKDNKTICGICISDDGANKCSRKKK